MPSNYTRKILVFMPNIGLGIFRWITWIARSATCVAWTTYTHWSRFDDQSWFQGRTIWDSLYTWHYGPKYKSLITPKRIFTTSYFDCWKKNRPGEE